MDRTIYGDDLELKKKLLLNGEDEITYVFFLFFLFIVIRNR